MTENQSFPQTQPYSLENRIILSIKELAKLYRIDENKIIREGFSYRSFTGNQIREFVIQKNEEIEVHIIQKELYEELTKPQDQIDHARVEVLYKLHPPISTAKRDREAFRKK